MCFNLLPQNIQQFITEKAAPFTKFIRKVAPIIQFIQRNFQNPLLRLLPTSLQQCLEQIIFPVFDYLYRHSTPGENQPLRRSNRLRRRPDFLIYNN